MPRLRWMAVALLTIPVLDIVLLIYVAGLIGAVATVALVVLTALVGLLLVRAEGRHTLMRLGRKLEAGEPPADELLDAALLIAAGAFLLTPGLVTDALGLLLVLPVTRYPIRLVLKRWVMVPILDDRTGGFATGRVYTFGFPDPDAGEPGTYDLGSDAYDVEVEDAGEDDDPGKGNA